MPIRKRRANREPKPYGKISELTEADNRFARLVEEALAKESQEDKKIN